MTATAEKSRWKELEDRFFLATTAVMSALIAAKGTEYVERLEAIRDELYEMERETGRRSRELS